MHSQDKVKVNIEKCRQIGMRLKDLDFRPSFYQREFLTVNADSETKARMYIYSSAICHQTYSLVNRKKNLKGWDYLEYVFLDLAKNNSSLLDPRWLASLSTGGLVSMMKAIFSEDGNPENCTLDRLEERAEFLIEVGKLVREKYGGNVSKLVESARGFLMNKGGGLYEILGQSECFSDPDRKKSTLFVKFLADAGMLDIKDPENLVPMMDYHMQRVLLRMGCVEIIDQGLKRQVLGREAIDSDVEIREACINALRVVSVASGHGILEMNDFFWPIGRSCCGEKVLCVDGVCNKNPCTFNSVVDLPSHSDCMFKGVCMGSVNPEYRRYWQPNVVTHFY